MTRIKTMPVPSRRSGISRSDVLILVALTGLLVPLLALFGHDIRWASIATVLTVVSGVQYYLDARKR